MRVLDKKIARDLYRMWAQALAIALVMACGVATLIISTGAYRSLVETRDAYYDRHRFGDIYATLKRAPLSLKDRIAQIPGVAAVELRAVSGVLLDIEGMREPAAGYAISLPDYRDAVVNLPLVRRGRLPTPGSTTEIAVNEAFAKANGFEVGSTLKAILDGTKQTLRISGLVMSPEFIYALGPGDMFPDNRRFGILFFSERALRGLLDLDGAFNDVTLRLLKGTNEQAVIDELDGLLGRYGGTGAIERKDQLSNAFIDGELQQLQAMARVIPPIFLLVSAFLINMILSRLIALEREQIGLFKAVGYSSFAVAVHYIKLVIAISTVGILIGFVAGTWMGRGLFALYAEFFHFPFLIFRLHTDIYVIAAGVSVVAAVAGGIKAVWSTVVLPPAVAMQPPAPTIYRRLLSERLGLLKPFSRLTVMGLRHLVRRPLRSALTTLGMAFAVGLMVTSLFFNDSTDFLIDWLYFQSERQDAVITFTDERGPSAMQAVGQLPGILRAEPARELAVTMRHGHVERRLGIAGKAQNASLSRVVTIDGQKVTLAESGLTLSERVASLLNARQGDLVEVRFLQGKRRTAEVPVTDIVPGFFGLTAFMDLAALDQLAGEGPRMSGANVMIDPMALDALYGAIKTIPNITNLVLLDVSRQKFGETIDENITIMMTVYVVLSIVIAFGVVYNSARIQLSERARELASLRVLGFTPGEVFGVLAVELGMIVAFAQPVGWLIGAGIAWLVVSGAENDLFRLPLIINTDTFAIGSMVTLTAVLASGFIIWRRVQRLDMIRVLKTRE